MIVKVAQIIILLAQVREFELELLFKHLFSVRLVIAEKFVVTGRLSIPSMGGRCLVCEFHIYA